MNGSAVLGVNLLKNTGDVGALLKKHPMLLLNHKMSSKSMKKPEFHKGVDTLAAKDKGAMMKETRKRKRAAGLVPKEIWVHNTRTNEEIKRAEKRLQKPLDSN